MRNILRFKTLPWLFLLLFLPLACSFPIFLSSGGPVSRDGQAAGSIAGLRGPIISAPWNATPTATPFQPIEPTPIYEPTRMPTATPGPDDQESEPTPTSGPALDLVPSGFGYMRPADQVTILLLGSDQRPGDPGFRTDAIILAILTPSRGTVSLVSFPRDLYLNIPGWTTNRINTAFARGGFDLLSQTLEYNFGIRADYYVMVNFTAFKETIDSLGGIKVDVAKTLTDQRPGKGQYTLPAGRHTLDGSTALWYVRSRYTTNDFDRNRRQQEVLTGLFARLMSLDAVQRAPELYEIYRNNVLTNLALDDIRPLLPLALQVSNTSNIQQYYIGPQEAYRYIVPYSGADVLLPNHYAIIEIIRRAVEGE
jgi:polyisoprenyl-teichoic acid--peptidoglycan teichoic acid transferase